MQVKIQLTHKPEPNMQLGYIEDGRWPGRWFFCATERVINILFPRTDHWCHFAYEGSLYEALMDIWNEEQVCPSLRLNEEPGVFH